MSWVAVAEDGEENFYSIKPQRQIEDGAWFVINAGLGVCTGDLIDVTIDGRTLTDEEIYSFENINVKKHHMGITLPKGSIKKLIGRDLTWEDEAVELKEE